MTQRRITPNYVFFYILFSQDTWRILLGLLVSVFVTPQILTPDMDLAARLVLYAMVAVIGYAAAGIPARLIAGGFRKLVLGDKKPQ